VGLPISTVDNVKQGIPGTGEVKSEYLISKYQTNPKFKIRIFQTQFRVSYLIAPGDRSNGFEFGILVI
jgi:hypothetical protein